MEPWEKHKDELRTLYSSKYRKVGTLRSIMAHMEAKHSFVKSKGQYERQFKKWGFHKNSTSEHWKTIHGKIQKRHAQGKKSAVYKSGMRVQVEKLNKEKRHNVRKADELFKFSHSAPIACCVEKYCQHATEELPGTPAGFTVCTPMADTTPPLLINNLPSLQLFDRLKLFVSFQPRHSNDPRSGTIEVLSGDDQAAFADATSQPYQFFDQRVVASANKDITASATLIGEEYHDNDGDLDLTLLKEWKLDGEDLKDLFQVSRTGKLSPLVLPMLHRASNNLLSWREATDIVNLIVRGSDRRVFNILISPRSPAALAIARSLLPAAIEHLDLELVRSLLESGISPDAPINYSRQSPLQFVLAGLSTNHDILDIVQLLLDYGAKADSPCTKRTSTPLVYAAGRGHAGLVRLLLAAGADVNANASAYEITALRAAAGAYVDMRASRAVADSDRLKITQLLLDAGADVNANPHGPHSGATALREAVTSRNFALTQMLLSHGANVNVPVIEGNRTALQVAASTGNLELINLLLIWGASDILPAIEWALEIGQRQAAEALLSYGPGLDDADRKAYNRMALGAGIRSGDYCFVRGLLESSVDMEARMGTHDTSRTTALQEAVSKADIDLARLLILFGANVNASAEGRYGKTALQAAALRGNTQLVSILLQAGADPNAAAAASLRGRTALRAAAGSVNGLEIVQMLLESGADLNGQWRIVLEAALDVPHKVSLELVYFLLENQPVSEVIDIDQTSGCVRWETLDSNESEQTIFEIISLLQRYNVLDGPYALANAINISSFELVEMLLVSGVDVNERCHDFLDDEAWPLEWSCFYFNLEIMQLCHAHGASIEQKSRALQSASYYGKIKAAEFLISCGADANAGPWFVVATEFEVVRTALQAAAEQGNIDLVRLLLDNGAEVERQSTSEDEQGTALQFAAMAGSIAIVNELIQRGANVNAAPLGEDGRTALEGAAEHGRLDMVQLLINLEAEVRGSRALEFAKDEGHDGVVTLLLENGFEDNDDRM